MSELEVFRLCKDQYETIDANLESLTNAVRKDVPADQVSQRLKQLAVAWDQAHLNYITAGNKVFDTNSQKLKDLIEEAAEVQEGIEKSIADLGKVKTILDQITFGATLLTSVVSLGAPLV